MKLESITATYSQYNDDNGKIDDADQFIEISSANAGAGDYFIINTNRWAFDNIQEFTDLLKDFEKRMK